jgi:succinate-acetate transporter protein
MSGEFSMSTVASELPHNHVVAPVEPLPAPVPTAPERVSGDPSVLGLPCFVVGSVALAFALVGYVPATADGGVLPIILAATGFGLLVSTVWAAALGQTMVACIFGVFAGFWLSYTVLVLGLDHNWFAVPGTAIQHTVAEFQIVWAIVMAALTLATVRLPVAFTAVVGLVVLALVLLAIGTLDTNTGFTHAAGIVTFAFAALGIYLFLSAASTASGGKGYPIGAPLVH